MILESAPVIRGDRRGMQGRFGSRQDSLTGFHAPADIYEQELIIINMKKKSLYGKVICAFLLLALIVSGCSGAASSSNTSASAGSNGSAGSAGQSAAAGEDLTESRLKVVTTIFPQYDFARQIGGDKADVNMLLKPGEEVHSYEPTPQDIKMIQNCDLFIYTGGENDVWVENILTSLGEEEGPHTVRLVDLVETYEEEHLEGMMEEKGHDHSHSHESGEEAEEEHDHDHESEEEHEHEAEEEHDHVSEAATITSGHTHVHGGEADEHVWTSPKNCVILIEKLTEEFCSEDPANADIYRANGDAYREAFEELDARYLEMAENAQRRTILFGDRFPFRYLAEELDLTCYAAFSGCSAESEPSAATIAFLIDKAAEEKLPVVFKIEFSNGYIANAISEAARVKMKKNAAAGEEIPEVQVLQLHSCHNLTANEFKAGETCLSLMTKNLEVLRVALDSPAE